MFFVCKQCFSDRELIGFIISQGNRGNCDCCESQDVEIIQLEELFDFFKDLFANFQAKPDGQSLISLIQGNWSLFRHLNYGHKILNIVLSDTESDIQNSEDLVGFSNDILENINYWSILKEQLKWENRYFANIEKLTVDFGWDGFFGSQTIINEEEIYYRARLHQNSEEPCYSIDKMAAPPPKFASAGRANPMGIPYLYLSDNEDTVLYEVRASYLDEISIATFTKNEDYQNEETGNSLIIADFTEVPSLYHSDAEVVTKKIKATLLKQLISRDLSKPMRRYDSEVDYIPTQFICEFIRTFTNVQGIKFRSSLHHTGSNLVLFNQDTMRCRTVKKVKVSTVVIKAINL